MSKYYYQTVTNSGSFACPMPDDYETADTIAELERAFYDWRDTVRQCSNESASLLIFKGEPQDLYPCARIPDIIFETGPRDGLVRS